MAPLSRELAGLKLDTFMSRFGPWDIASFAPEALTFTVVLDGAKSDFVSVELVPVKSAPRGAILDARFPGFVPFVTDVALDWEGFRKVAGKILGIPPGAIAIGVDPKGTAILIHAIGFTEGERAAIGKDRMIEVALNTEASSATRRNPSKDQKKGGPAGVWTHSPEWKAIEQHDEPDEDWLMTRANRTLAYTVAVSISPLDPKHDGSGLPIVDDRDPGAIRNALGEVVVFSFRGVTRAEDLKGRTYDNRHLRTWRECKWQMQAGMPQLGKGAGAGQEALDKFLPGRGLVWGDKTGTPNAMEQLWAESNPGMLVSGFDPERAGFGAEYRWLCDIRSKELETEFDFRQLRVWADRQNREYVDPKAGYRGARVHPVLQWVIAHLEAVCKGLGFKTSTVKLVVPGWDIVDPVSGKLVLPTVADVITSLSARPVAYLGRPQPAEKEFEEARAMRAAGSGGVPDRVDPEKQRQVQNALLQMGSTPIVDPFKLAERLLREELTPEDFMFEDYVDNDPHFMTVRAAQFIPPAIQRSFEDVLKAKSSKRVSLVLRPRFPKWAAGIVFDEWHRRNAVLKRRLMEVWIHIDKRRAILQKQFEEQEGNLLALERVDPRGYTADQYGRPSEEQERRLMTARAGMRGILHGIEELREITKKIAKKLRGLGVDVSELESPSEAGSLAWAEKWIKDKAWREEHRATFRGGRVSVVEKVKGIGPWVRKFWAELDRPATEETEFGVTKKRRAGPLRAVKMAIGRWQARTALRELSRMQLVSKKITGIAKKAYEASGWQAIGEDYKRMRIYAAASWDNLKDVTRFAGGVVQAPASVLHNQFKMPIARLHDWLEEKALPGFKISVSKLARREQRWKRVIDRKTGESSFIDEQTGAKVDPPRIGRADAVPVREKILTTAEPAAAARAATAEEKKRAQKLLRSILADRKRIAQLEASPDPRRLKRAQSIRRQLAANERELELMGMTAPPEPAARKRPKGSRAPEKLQVRYRKLKNAWRAIRAKGGPETEKERSMKAALRKIAEEIVRRGGLLEDEP